MLGNLCIQRFSSMSLKFWPALEVGGAWITFRIEISMPENFAGLCLVHLLKCLATVVGLLCAMSK